jgi:hypothetical protein
LAALWCQQQQQSSGSRIAAARRHSGVKDTDGNCDGGGTDNNHQSTESSGSSGGGNGGKDVNQNIGNGGCGGSLAAVQHWRQRQHLSNTAAVGSAIVEYVGSGGNAVEASCWQRSSSVGRRWQRGGGSGSTPVATGLAAAVAV